MAIYNNPYQTNYPTYQPASIAPVPASNFNPQPRNQGITWVNGEEAARSYPIPYNSTVMLMDQETPVLYVKTVDSMGRIVDFEIYDLINRSPKKEDVLNFNTEEFVKKDDLQKMMEGINKRFDELSVRRTQQNRREDK